VCTHNEFSTLAQYIHLYDDGITMREASLECTVREVDTLSKTSLTDPTQKQTVVRRATALPSIQLINNSQLMKRNASEALLTDDYKMLQSPFFLGGGGGVEGGLLAYWPGSPLMSINC
jgi:hypothetical protein